MIYTGFLQKIGEELFQVNLNFNNKRDMSKLEIPHLLKNILLSDRLNSEGVLFNH